MDKPLTREALRDKIGRSLNVLATGLNETPTDPLVVRVLDLLMEGIDLYVEGLGSHD